VFVDQPRPDGALEPADLGEQFAAGMAAQIGIENDIADIAVGLQILRHDIDTDLCTARSMWLVEKALGIRSSYFFRLSTIDEPFMQEIESEGGSVGYHFEELSMMAKRRGLNSREKVFNKLPEICELFESNLIELRNRTQLPLRYVAAHGDFVNRRLGIPNWVILQDSALRERLSIELEAYDSKFMQCMISRHTDREYPVIWVPEDPLNALEAGIPSVHVLVHPRQWRVNWRENFTDDLQRMYEGFLYSRGIENRSLAWHLEARKCSTVSF